MRVEILERTGPTALTKIWRVDGDPVDAGTVTYELIDPDGTVALTGTATKNGTGASTTYTVTIPVAEALTLNEYRLEWTRTDTGAVLTDDVGIVGSVLFTESEARTFSTVGGINPLSDDAAYTDRAIAEARYRITDLLERRCGVSFIRRFGRVRTTGTGSARLRLVDAAATHGGAGFRRRPLAVLSAAVNGVAFTAGELSAVDVDNLANTFTRFDGNGWSAPAANQPRQNVVVAYEYGYRSPPWEANRAALMLLMKSIIPSDVSARATSFSNPDGTFRLSTPSLMHPTGVPEIDEFIVAHDERSLFA